MYLATVAVLAMTAVALLRRRPDRPPSRAFGLAAGLLAGQILLGAINVWAGKHAGLILGHLMLATLLWTTVVYAAATLLPATARVPQPVGARRAAEVTA
jgi:heme A synthase